MNIEKKTKIFLSIILFSFAVLAIVFFFLHKSLFMVFFSIFLFAGLLLIGLETYLRIQHNIDKKYQDTRIFLNSNFRNMEESLDREFFAFKNRERNFGDELITIIEGLVSKVENIDNKIESMSSQADNMVQKINDEDVKKMHLFVENLEISNKEIIENQKLALEIKKNIAEAVDKMGIELRRFEKNDLDSIVALFKTYIDAKFSNNNLIQKKMSNAIEELIDKKSE